MKCYYDKNEAFAICLKCGKLLCKDCTIIEDNKCYCPECANLKPIEKNANKTSFSSFNEIFNIGNSKYKILNIISIILCACFIVSNLLSHVPFIFMYIRYFKFTNITYFLSYLAAFSLLIVGNIFILKDNKNGLSFCFGFLIPLLNPIQSIGIAASFKMFFINNFFELIPLILTLISGFILKEKVLKCKFKKPTIL